MRRGLVRLSRINMADAQTLQKKRKLTSDLELGPLVLMEESEWLFRRSHVARGALGTRRIGW